MVKPQPSKLMLWIRFPLSALYASLAQLAEQSPCLPNLFNKNMLSSKQKGNLTELECITAFYQNGYAVSIPYGENSRYDFVADIKGKLYKIQVKTSSQKVDDPDVITFQCRSTRVNTKGNFTRRYTSDEIDFFATFWNGQCYLIPINECSLQKNLRFSPPKNGQVKGITFAEDYKLENQLKKIGEEK